MLDKIQFIFHIVIFKTQVEIAFNIILTWIVRD